jgi:signal transduction histidine kinase
MTRSSLGSLRVRFVVAALVWVSIATLLAGLVISGLYRAHLTRNFHDELEVHLIELVRLADVDASGRPVLDRPLSDPRFQEEGSGFYWQIDREGYEPVTSAALGGKRLPIKFASATQEHAGWIDGPNGEILECGITAPSRDGGPPLQFSIATDRRVLEETLAGFNHDLALSLTAFALFMVVGAMLQIRYGLQPARRIADNIDDLRRGTISRLPTDAPTEFSPIVTRLNGLLDAQAALVQRARIETGNLGHGLRTPLALISDEAEELGNRGESKASDFILAQCAKIQRQLDYHMMRARAAGRRETGYVANASTLVQQIVTAMQRLHGARNISFVVDIPAGTTVNCDEGDLAEILSNLIDNACKWARGRVSIGAHAAPAGTVIEIADDGPGIAPGLRAHVFDVGTRLDESKAGSGLGLAISRDLARLYGGDLALRDGPDGGLLARLSFPSNEA